MFRVTLLLAALALLPLGAAAETVQVGVLAYRGAERASVEWEPTLRHLAAALPDIAFHTVPLDLPGMNRAVAAGEIQFVITNPGHYVELESRYGVARIATFATENGPAPSAALGSAVIVRADRKDLKDLADLRGRRIAAVLPEAFGGFRVAWRELAAKGIDPFRNAETVFLGFPMERIVDAVAQGEVDAGIVRACLLEGMAAEQRIRAEDFRVLDPHDPSRLGCRTSTRLYPDWPFAKLASTPDVLAKRIGIALLGMPATDGHAWTVPVDYQSVHDLFRELKIGPYEHLRNRTVAETLRAYWPWLVVLALVGLWWIAHVAHIETLVRRRTRELQAALEEAERQRAEKEHGARLALLGEMASSLAHEINQPLAAIANYASGCERRLAAGNDPAGVAEGVHLIAGQAERAAGIVRRIRAFVRKRGPELADIDLNEVVRESLDLFHGVAGRRGATVTAKLASPLPPVRADRIQVGQVVLNLLQNAADAMADAPVRHLSIITGIAEDGVEVAVSDSGAGLTPEAREHLFEPFFTTKPQGLGLGLSLSRSIVEAHGGRLYAEDAPAGGACFRFTLPIASKETA